MWAKTAFTSWLLFELAGIGGGGGTAAGGAGGGAGGDPPVSFALDGADDMMVHSLTEADATLGKYIFLIFFKLATFGVNIFFLCS